MARVARFVYFATVPVSIHHHSLARSRGLLSQFGLVLLILSAAGCASVAGPQLLPYSPVVPDGVDLSGRWLLRDADSDPLIRFSHQGFIGPGSAADVLRLARNRQGAVRLEPRGGTRGQAALAQVFLETGSDVRLTQTGEGLFISYDRSIVEEYLFGEHRAASVGPVIAERVSGWDGPRYVIQTLDEDGVLLTERWYLEDEALKRDVAFSEGDVVQYAVTQSFDRAP